MVNEFGKRGFGFVQVGKRHHRRGSGKEHGELVHEVANRGTRAGFTEIELGGKGVLLDVQRAAEEAYLFRFRFEVVILLVRQHEIEHGETPADEIQLVGAAIAEVLFLDPGIEPPGEKVIDDTAHGIAPSPGVLLALHLVPKDRSPFAPMGAGEAEKLTRHKVARVGRNDVKKPRFFLGVAKGFQDVEMGRRDVHSVRIPAVRSWSFRMRRRRDASSGRLVPDFRQETFGARVPCTASPTLAPALIPGRTRDRAGDRRLSASPGPREESGENSPHLLGNMQRRKSNKKIEKQSEP